MADEIRKRLAWIKMYEETGDAGFTCRKCGISRPTLRKWYRRYKQYGEAGLASESRKPLHSPNQKVFKSKTIGLWKSEKNDGWVHAEFSMN